MMDEWIKKYNLSFPRKWESRILNFNIKMKVYYIYILANKRNGTLYIGVTDNLIRRVAEHKRILYKNVEN
jgi:hypothetical protein